MAICGCLDDDETTPPAAPEEPEEPPEETEEPPYERPEPPEHREVSEDDCQSICRGACIQMKLATEILIGKVDPDVFKKMMDECAWCCKVYFLDEDPPFDSLRCFRAGVGCA